MLDYFYKDPSYRSESDKLTLEIFIAIFAEKKN